MFCNNTILLGAQRSDGAMAYCIAHLQHSTAAFTSTSATSCSTPLSGQIQEWSTVPSGKIDHKAEKCNVYSLIMLVVASHLTIDALLSVCIAMHGTYYWWHYRAVVSYRGLKPSFWLCGKDIPLKNYGLQVDLLRIQMVNAYLNLGHL